EVFPEQSAYFREKLIGDLIFYLQSEREISCYIKIMTHVIGVCFSIVSLHEDFFPYFKGPVKEFSLETAFTHLLLKLDVYFLIKPGHAIYPVRIVFLQVINQGARRIRIADGTAVEDS